MPQHLRLFYCIVEADRSLPTFPGVRGMASGLEGALLYIPIDDQKAADGLHPTAHLGRKPRSRIRASLNIRERNCAVL
jgi:hypothetical protein